MAKLSYLRSFRLTCGPESWQAVENLLGEEGYVFEKEPFSPFCRRLVAEPKPLGSSLAALFGYIYIQDRSSMLPPLALDPDAGSAVLDMCASPGSKTGFLAQLTGRAGFVLANEPSPSRLETLRANMHQANLLNVATCSMPGEMLDAGVGAWSHILLDPPCSGWGTEEKNPLVRKLWHGDKLDMLRHLQRALLARAEQLLAPGGMLLYSTCTTNYGENEAQTIYAETELGMERVPLQPFSGFVFEHRKGGEGCLLVSARASAAQGFYLSLLRKPGKAEKDAPLPTELPGHAAPRSQLCDANLFPCGNIRVFGGKVRFLPALSTRLPQSLKWQGAFLGKTTRAGGFQPAPRLRYLPSDCPRIQLDDVNALRAMLSGQALRTDCAAKLGALWWRNLPLGTVGVKAGRIIAPFR